MADKERRLRYATIAAPLLTLVVSLTVAGAVLDELFSGYSLQWTPEIFSFWFVAALLIQYLLYFLTLRPAEHALRKRKLTGIVSYGLLGASLGPFHGLLAAIPSFLLFVLAITAGGSTILHVSALFFGFFVLNSSLMAMLFWAIRRPDLDEPKPKRERAQLTEAQHRLRIAKWAAPPLALLITLEIAYLLLHENLPGQYDGSTPFGRIAFLAFLLPLQYLTFFLTRERLDRRQAESGNQYLFAYALAGFGLSFLYFGFGLIFGILLLAVWRVFDLGLPFIPHIPLTLLCFVINGVLLISTYWLIRRPDRDALPTQAMTTP